MRTPPSRWLLLALVSTLYACDSQASLERTIPANGGADMPERSIVAVRLSSSMSDSDVEKNTDPRWFTVTGDQTPEPYTGSVVAADFADVFEGQTVEDFRQGVTQPGGDPGGDEDGQEGGDGDGDENGDDDSDGGGSQAVRNTLVWLLDDGQTFKQGETITVVVSPRVVVRGTAMDHATRFSFTVEGGSALAQGDFFVVSTEPAPESADAGLNPLLRGTFSQPARTETLAEGISVRGLQSGLHEGGGTLFPEGAATVEEVARRLEAGDSFVPGEWVELAFTRGIQASGDASLSPFLSRFQTRPGRIRDAASAWIEGQLIATEGAPRFLVAADFRPMVAGVDVAAVFPERVELYRRIDGGDVWTRSETALPDAGQPRGAAAIDVDDDGLPELVLVLERDEEGRVLVLGATEGGSLEEEDDPVEFPAGPIDDVVAADLDSDGRRELLVVHEDVEFIPEPGPMDPAGGEEPEPQRTGHATVLALRQGAPAGGVDPNDPDALLRRRFERQPEVLPLFEPSSRIEVRDLDRDGRHDLVAETADGLLLWRNQGTSQSPFAFRKVGLVAGSGGAAFVPDAWTLLDVDTDGDVDLLSWRGGETLLHENGAPPRGESPAGSVTRGLLFETVEPVRLDVGVTLQSGDRALATNADGDPEGIADLVVVRADGSLELLLGQGGDPPSFADPVRGSDTGGTRATVFADANGDTGLDIVVSGDDAVRALLTDPAQVEEVTPPEPDGFDLVVTSETETEVVVSVIGDLRSSFAGYSVAVDYDEAVLEYAGFVVPPSFERTADFTLCPNQQLLGCPGVAGARMSFRQGTVSRPAEDVLLGRLRFSKLEVDETSTSEVELRDFEAGEQTFRNSVTVAEAGLTQEVPVTMTGEPVEVTVEPPAPEPGPELAVDCEVLERLDDSFRARVVWESPRGTSFMSVRIVVGGVVLPPVDWDLGFHEFTSDAGGQVPIVVTALREGEDPADPPENAPSLECGLVSVFRPQVVCEEREASNVIRWSLEDHAVDSFNVYRNGVRIGTVPGTDDFVFEDRFPSPEGADSYAVAGVVGSVEGPRGRCRGQDPSPCTTLDLTARSAALDSRPEPSSPNVLRFRWRNGEAYDRILVHLFFTPPSGGEEVDLFPSGRVLPGEATNFVYDSDPDRGGAEPGTYRIRLEGRVSVADGTCPGDPGELATSPLEMGPVEVPTPSLDGIELTCMREGLSALRVSWLPVWRGFDRFLALEVQHTVDGETTSHVLSDILVSDTTRGITELGGARVEPVGSYEFTLTATRDGQSMSATCGPLGFEPSVATGDVEAGIGLTSFDLPIRASGVFQRVTGFELELEFPDFVSLEGFSPQPSGTPGRVVVSLRRDDVLLDPDPDGDRQSEGVLELIRLRGHLPVDFGLVERSGEPLVVANARLRFEGAESFRPVSSGEGALLVRERHVALDRAEVPAGDDGPVRIAARATFRAPPEVPDYRFNAFQIHLAFDPDLLEVLPVTLEDQATTAVAGEGFHVLPNAQALEEANRTGRLRVAWLGFDFANPTDPAFLEPVTNEEVWVFRFRSLAGENDPEAFASISFVTDPDAEQPTAFFPEETVPGVPDMEAFFDGGIRIRSSAPPLTLAAISPPRGPFGGGNEVVLLGRGFPTGSGEALSVRFRSLAGDVLEVPSDAVLRIADDELRVTAPDSGLRAATFTAEARLHDVEIETSAGTSRLVRAYAYERPVIESTDVTSVRAGAGDFIRVSGRGLSPSAEVELVVGGDGAPFSASVFRAAPDGRELVVVPTGLPSPEPGEDLLAELRIHNLPDPVVLRAPERIRILPAPEDAGLEISSVTPDAASLCGGTELTLLGSGFTAATTVSFGDVAAASVEYASASELRVVTPGLGEAGTVMLRVRESGQVAETPFVVEAPPDFIRGDVDEDGGVDMQDATLLSRIVVEGPGGATPSNRDAWDVDDNGTVDSGDAIRLLSFLYEGGEPPPPPFPDPGPDPTPDAICQ